MHNSRCWDARSYFPYNLLRIYPPSCLLQYPSSLPTIVDKFCCATLTTFKKTPTFGQRLALPKLLPSCQPLSSFFFSRYIHAGYVEMLAVTFHAIKWKSTDHSVCYISLHPLNPNKLSGKSTFDIFSQFVIRCPPASFSMNELRVQV